MVSRFFGDLATSRASLWNGHVPLDGVGGLHRAGQRDADYAGTSSAELDPLSRTPGLRRRSLDQILERCDRDPCVRTNRSLDDSLGPTDGSPIHTQMTLFTSKDHDWKTNANPLPRSAISTPHATGGRKRHLCCTRSESLLLGLNQ